MTDDLEKKSQESSFRDQILRDLEEQRLKKMTERPQVQPSSPADLIKPEQALESALTIEPDLPVAPLAFKEEVLSQPEVEKNAHETAVQRFEIEYAVDEDVEEEALPTPPEDFASPATEPVALDETIVLTKPKERAKSSTMSRKTEKKGRKKKEKTANRIVTVVAVIVLLALVATGVTGYAYVKSSLDPIDTADTAAVQVEIPEGSTTKEIGQILVDSGLIKNATIFNYYTKFKNYTGFKSGYYTLNRSMSVDTIAKTLQEEGAASAQDPNAGKILVVEGYTIDQIATAITDNANTEDTTDKTPFTADQFLATIQNQDFINRMVATYPTLLANLPAADSGVRYQLEGYLFPATYEYTKDTTIEQLVEQMIATMDNRMQPYYSQLAEKGLDVNSLLTIASLVEKEGSTDEDRKTIAGVFYNRLNAGMPLQSNIAVLYAMGKLGQVTTLAEDAAIDTSIDSPYNVYVHTGLMPGPVDNPGTSAIDAAFNQNKTGYYYFVADVTTGKVYYSTTLEEHEQNVATYVNSKISQ